MKRGCQSKDWLTSSKETFPFFPNSTTFSAMDMDCTGFGHDNRSLFSTPSVHTIRGGSKEDDMHGLKIKHQTLILDAPKEESSIPKL